MTFSDENYSVLIDTNAMISISLLFEACNYISVSCDSPIETIKDKFDQEFENCKDYIEFEEIKKGSNCFAYLLKKREEFPSNIEYNFSLLSEFEIRKAILEHQYHKDMTRRGMPFRIRRKNPLHIQFSYDYQNDVLDYWRNIKANIENFNIQITCPEYQDGVMRDTIDVISTIVSKHIALGSQDLYLYSLAIKCCCNEIITYDSDFRDTINQLRTREEYRSRKEAIIQELIQLDPYNLEFEDTGTISLPEGKKGKE
ncbi:hypothetical protein DSECCO2_86050 [anaerobic digester metagenome]